MDPRLREDDEKKMDPRFREDDAGKAPVLTVFFRHSCAGRNPSPHLLSVIFYLK